jgi:hypothetical protein
MKAVDALMVIELDIGPKVRGFKPERGNGFLRSHFQMNFWSSAGELCVEEKIQP